MTTDNTNNNENNINEEVPDEVETFTCEWCTEDVTELSNESPDLCERCVDNYALTCEHPRCGDLIHYDDSFYINQTNERVCEDCYNRRYNSCYRHDTAFPNDDVCESCSDEGYDDDDDDYGDGNARIRSYSYKPSALFHDIVNGRVFQFHRDSGDQPVMGMELEMEFCGADGRRVVEILDDAFGQFAYFKHDGSLNDGVEMVTHPATLNYIRSLEWNRLREVTKLGVRSSNAPGATCGLHVHISKKYFEKRPTTFYRFLNMYYSFAEQWKAIANRDSHYGRFIPVEQAPMLQATRLMARHGAGEALYGERYVAVNLNNSQTAELRFFKGTLNPVSVVGTLESVHAVARFARASQFQVNPKALTWEKFREFTINEGYEAFNTLATKRGV